MRSSSDGLDGTGKKNPPQRCWADRCPAALAAFLKRPQAEAQIGAGGNLGAVKTIVNLAGTT
jgi:hypothetical protein